VLDYQVIDCKSTI